MRHYVSQKKEVNMDTFEERWKQIWVQSGLPSTAQDQIPGCLSATMKKRVLHSKMSDAELGRVFSSAVAEINRGSIKGIEDLVKKSIYK